jgi:hypothetical protein
MARQNGLFTAQQAYCAGHNFGEIQHLRERQALHSVRRGVYAFRETYLSLDELARHATDVRAVLLKVHQPTTISHESAAVLADLPLLRPKLHLVHATRPELRASRREAGVHHHPGSLPGSHVREVGAIALTADARTAVDIARTNDFARGLAAVDSARRAGTSAAELQAALEFCSSWPGARGASRAVTYGDPRAANPGESWSRAVLIDNDLAPTDLQFAVHDQRGLIGYTDVAWRDRLTVGEFDGRHKYAVLPGADADGAARILWEEKLREDRLRAAGFEVVRWTWADLYRPAELLMRLSAAFARAAVRHSRGA